MGETAISKQIVDTFRARGCIVTRVQSGIIRLPGRVMHLAKKGTPDLHVLAPEGLSFWVEVKTPTGKRTPEQVAWADHAAALGHRVYVMDSVEDARGFILSVDLRWADDFECVAGPLRNNIDFQELLARAGALRPDVASGKDSA